MFRKRERPVQGGEKLEKQSFIAGLKARLSDWRGWLNFILLFAALEVAVLSIEQARWIEQLPSLTLTLILSMLVVWAFVILRLHSIIIHIAALGAGALATMWQASSLEGSPSYYFAVFLLAVTWVMGYLSAWSVLRKRNAWVAVAFGALVVLVNLSNLPMRYYIYFGYYFVAAVFLIVQTRIVRRHFAPEPTVRRTGRGLIYLVSSLLCIVVISVAISWVIPEVRFPQFQTLIASKIIWKQDFEQSRFNFFASVPSKQSLNTNSMRLNLPFGASWHLGDRIDFIVNAAKPSYWRVRAYDIYTASGWENSAVTDTILKSKHAWEETKKPEKSETIMYTVTPNIKTDALLTSGSFISTNKPVLVQVGAGDIIGIMASHILSAGERYSVTAAVAEATPKQLDEAGDNYTQLILDNYLQLPEDFPESIRKLSENITDNTTTPYEKVIKINEYLSHIPYETDIEAPAEGVDGVEHFLFVQKSGFCVHFASAMAVMLRSVDVPTRLAIGYLPGDPGEKTGEYILRDKYYHAWPQVYFPEYGWVDIEATPSTTESPGAGSAVALSEPVVSSDTIRDLPQWEVWFNPALYDFGIGQGGGGGSAGSGAVRGPRGPWSFAGPLGLALLIMLLLGFFIGLLTLPFLLLRSSFYKWAWRVDRANLATATYEKMCQLGAMVKHGPRPQQTPLEYTALLEAEFPEQAKEVQEITQAYLERRFGGREAKIGLFDEARILKARRSIFEKIMGRLSQVEKIFWGRL